VNYALRDARDNWRWMVGAPVLPASAMLLGIFVLPESPRWLVIRGRLADALEVIHGLREHGREMPGQDRSTALVEAELMELWSAVEKEYYDDPERSLRVSLDGRGCGEGGSGGTRTHALNSHAMGGAAAAAVAGAATAGTAAASVGGQCPNSIGDVALRPRHGFFRTLLTMLVDIGRVVRVNTESKQKRGSRQLDLPDLPNLPNLPNLPTRKRVANCVETAP